MRCPGATRPLSMRADIGFYNHDIVAACRNKCVRFSITVRQYAQLRNLIETIPEENWASIPYWMEGTAAVAETEYTPFENKPDAALVRLIVRRVNVHRRNSGRSPSLGYSLMQMSTSRGVRFPGRRLLTQDSHCDAHRIIAAPALNRRGVSPSTGRAGRVPACADISVCQANTDLRRSRLCLGGRPRRFHGSASGAGPTDYA